ncbi:hypothetical protein EYF80_016001 [Liparis tanakae]|uniref:Uncharacterized protein n=1 Tax=Liparis tanakae TaxID=230148 RepID=A0A4Z2I9J4_9TELE|nr:hypothetical protein EYF80_016001 [Liparis tanakae]
MQQSSAGSSAFVSPQRAAQKPRPGRLAARYCLAPSAGGAAYKSMSWSTSSMGRAKLGRLDSEPPLLLREWPPETGRRNRGGGGETNTGKQREEGGGGGRRRREAEERESR